MKKLYPTFCISICMVILGALNMRISAQSMMPLPPHSSVYSGIYVRGLWFIAPIDFTITGLRIAPEAGTGKQYIHLMKLLTAPNGSTTGSTNFVTLAYDTGGANNTIRPVSAQVKAGDMIGIMGTTTGICNSYAATGIVTSDIGGFPVNLNRFGYQGSIESAPAPNYWGNTNATSGQIARIFMYYSIKSGFNNAGVNSIPSPSNFCAGVQEVKVRIANKGTNRLDSVRVNWSLDGIPRPTVFWTSPLDTSGSTILPSDTLITLDTVNFSANAARVISVWTSMPNGVADTITNDDSLTVTRKASLNGVFTIGGANPDYPTFAAAAADLNSYGVCGPVTFNVRTGSYSGQMSLGNISGATSVNRILFQSEAGHPDSVTLTMAATAATDNFVVKLTGTSFTKFNKLKLVSTNASFSRIFDISGGSAFDTIEGCSLISATATASSVNTAVIYTDGNLNSGLVVKDNLIQGGSWGFRLYGSGTTSKVVGMAALGNQFVNQYIYGIYAYYHQNSKIRSNRFTSNTTATYYGIYSYYGDSSIEIVSNRITGITTGYGIYTYYNYGNPFQPVVIANNVVVIGGTGIARGIHSYYSIHNRINYNSFLITSTSATTGYGGYFYYSSTTYTGNDIRNNIFANAGGGYAVYCYNPTLAGVSNVLDYNNYFTTGTALAQIGAPASTPANIAAWKATSLQDANSLSYRPGFTSNTDLTPNPADTAVWSVNGRGIHINAVTTDILGNPRPQTPSQGIPDLGAFEVTPTVAAPNATIVGTLAAGNTNFLLFGGDSVGRIVWDVAAAVPSALSVKQYAGSQPPQTSVSAGGFMLAYLDLIAPAGTAGYTLHMFYKDHWIGTNPNETDLKIAQKSNNLPTSSWLAYTNASSYADTVKNMLVAYVPFDYGLFTGTDNNNPLPVTLSDGLTGMVKGQDAILHWTTVSEINSNYFEIEASSDGINYHPVARIKAAGNSSRMLGYKYVHEQAFAKEHVSYYRLRMVDRDQTFEYSNTLRLSNGNHVMTEPSIMPNPFNGTPELTIDLQEAATVFVTATDLSGATVFETSLEATSGRSVWSLKEFSTQPAGMYFIEVMTPEGRFVVKAQKAE